VDLKVENLQIDDEYATIAPKATIQEAGIIIQDKNISYLIAIEGKQAIGLLSDRDIIEKVVAKGKNVQETLVHEIMKPIISVKIDDTVEFCLDQLAKYELPALAVVNEQKELIGVVTLTDCLGTGTIFDLSEENLL
jgi:CBS domain-containing protein